MASTRAVLLVLSLSVMLLINSSEVSEAADLSETSAEPASKETDQYGGGGGGGGGGGRGGGRYCRYGCCRRGYYGCRRCCYYAGENPDADVDAKTEAKPQN